MFNKILIANRGEIACRIMRSARRLGIQTVAVYSDADQHALHVKMADEAWHIGPAPSAESYLKGERIIDVAKRSGAQAIHPGYGFLSENPDFVEQVDAAGLRFIGPSAAAIRAMGLKDAAKALMEKAGVAVVPGYHGNEQDPDALAAIADKIGYPVLIKARAGGGGKGMRRVDSADQFKTALESAQREGLASFGDAHCLVEKYLLKPRHIEIQVFGDDHGNVVHLFERDCSLQRRHQKVIEEAPAPDMPVAMRERMGEAAVKAAKAIQYSGAGTVEFIADVSQGLDADRFYFMEMNTRLQVEHPVTELITGEDLVEWQLMVAAGHPLPKSQDALRINGWAFEARIYAEDVPKGFLPATGTLQHLSLPEQSARVDSGVTQGDTISPFYDPMIAKLIVHGESRAIALQKLVTALSQCQIAGSVTNVAFLAALCRNPSFAGGDVDTGIIDRDLDSLIEDKTPTITAHAVAALAALGLLRPTSDPDPWVSLTGWRMWSNARQFIVLEHGDQRREWHVVAKAEHSYSLDSEGESVELSIDAIDGHTIHLNVDGHIVSATAVDHGRAITIFIDGSAFEFALPDRLSDDDDGGESADSVSAPMPGLVKVVSCQVGQAVKKEDTLLVLEAMKMEHSLTAPRDGVIKTVLVSAGDQVEDASLLVQFEPVDET